MNRPATNGVNGSFVTTPRAQAMIRLLGGGMTHDGVALTGDERIAVMGLYGYEPEKAMKEHDAAVKVHASCVDPRTFFQAGADRNSLRHAVCDGLRMLAWIAKFVPPGEDPVRHLVQLAIDAGWDVDPADVEWVREVTTTERSA